MKPIVAFLWIASAGLFPLWYALYTVYKGSQGASADYMVAAPWLVIYALFICAITLALAVTPVIAYAATQGSASRKLYRAVGWFFLATGLACGCAGMYWAFHKAQKAEVASVQETARRFVMASPSVQSAAPFRISVISTEHSARGRLRAFKYYVAATGRSDRSLIVTVNVSGPEFQITCIVTDDEHRNSKARC